MNVLGIKLSDENVEISPAHRRRTESKIEIASFENHNVRTSHEFDWWHFDAVYAPLFRTNIQAVEVLGRTRRYLQVELRANRLRSAVKDAERLDMSAIPGDRVVDDLAIIAGAKRFADRQHVNRFEQPALAVPVSTGENYEPRFKVDVGINVVAETG